MSAENSSAKAGPRRGGSSAGSLEAWRAGLTFAILLVIAGMLNTVIAHSLLGTLPWQDLQAIAAGTGAVAALLLLRSRGRSVGLASFVVLALSLLIMASLNQLLTRQTDWPIPSLLGHKLGLIAIGLLAPSTVAGLLLVVAFSADAVALLLWTAGAPPGLIPEPWSTLIVAAGAVGLLLYRGRTRLARQAVEREHARQAATQQLARTLLAIRDLANTPLQTLSLTAALLSDRDPEDPLPQRMKRALDQLGRLNEILLAQEEKLRREWSQSDASFDALKEVEASLRPPAQSGDRPSSDP